MQAKLLYPQPTEPYCDFRFPLAGQHADHCGTGLKYRKGKRPGPCQSEQCTGLAGPCHFLTYNYHTSHFAPLVIPDNIYVAKRRLQAGLGWAVLHNTERFWPGEVQYEPRYLGL